MKPERKILTTIKKQADGYQEPEDFDAWFATNDNFQEHGISAEIWEPS